MSSILGTPALSLISTPSRAKRSAPIRSRSRTARRTSTAPGTPLPSACHVRSMICRPHRAGALSEKTCGRAPSRHMSPEAHCLPARAAPATASSRTQRSPTTSHSGSATASWMRMPRTDRHVLTVDRRRDADGGAAHLSILQRRRAGQSPPACVLVGIGGRHELVHGRSIDREIGRDGHQPGRVCRDL